MKSRLRAIDEGRVYSAWLIYARMLILVLFAVPVGLLVYSIFTQNAGAGTASIIVGISLGLFYRSAGRMVLRNLRNRRDRVLARLAL